MPMNFILGFSTLRNAKWLFDFPQRRISRQSPTLLLISYNRFFVSVKIKVDYPKKTNVFLDN
jgi:hypothetical protein